MWSIAIVLLCVCLRRREIKRRMRSARAMERMNSCFDQNWKSQLFLNFGLLRLSLCSLLFAFRAHHMALSWKQSHHLPTYGLPRTRPCSLSLSPFSFFLFFILRHWLRVEILRHIVYNVCLWAHQWEKKNRAHVRVVMWARGNSGNYMQQWWWWWWQQRRRWQACETDGVEN